MLFLVRSLHKLLIKESLTCHVEMNNDKVDYRHHEYGVLKSGPGALDQIQLSKEDFLSVISHVNEGSFLPKCP
jgi:hypothetical protein